ncbi:UDP-2,3-diacylglucosamine diphosphatase [Fulvivirga sp. M361]|uniref:UDP-2,3-diacylglucosamine diphosphatase n=1 Tax=Fulvivirga sp. M361 TaxID=2594266 RepID=UPI001179CE55|nr:UDP-2,3-diacylglucosamine diphosphatase [Fulvivirga sp. M361]TRX57716.1 UDP-2,3-diacylglucosamine diphosphatase [Fulvivirga sp. M361]
MLAEVSSLDNQYIYFASDFHLGAISKENSREREKKIVRWLNMIQKDAHTIYLMGDIFDFWFEYRQAIPKGFIRLQGKLAELTDAGIPVVFFTGNHDMWMFDYFPSELGIPIYRDEQVLKVGQQKLFIGHGDGLGPGDHTYKLLKKVFRSPLCQWLFERIHPNLGISIANFWSRSSRIRNTGGKSEDKFLGEKEFLIQYCKEQELREHHDFYVFGHRHLPLEVPIGESSKYINLGEWVNHFTYAKYDGKNMQLLTFEKDQ